MGLCCTHSCLIAWEKSAENTALIFVRVAGDNGRPDSHFSTATVLISESFTAPHWGETYSFRKLRFTSTVENDLRSVVSSCFK